MGRNSDDPHDWFARNSQLTRHDAESLARAEGRLFRHIWPGSMRTDDERADRLTIVSDEHGELVSMFPG
jgi:hypothetical protein